MSRKNALRGCIIMKWKTSGSNEFVQYDQVLQWAKDCDHDFRKRGLNPAPAFRNYLESGGERLKTYLRGERFPFHIVDDSNSPGSIQKYSTSSRVLSTGDSARRACLQCGRLNLLDAIYCSYCRQAMPRGPNEEVFNR
jgi:hypothetical protein